MGWASRRIADIADMTHAAATTLFWADELLREPPDDLDLVFVWTLRDQVSIISSAASPSSKLLGM